MSRQLRYSFKHIIFMFLFVLYAIVIEN